MSQTGENGRSKTQHFTSNRHKMAKKDTPECGRSQPRDEPGSSKRGLPYIVVLVLCGKFVVLLTSAVV